MNPRSQFGVSVSIVFDDRGALVTTEGELDRATVAAFDQCLEEVLETGRSPLTVDLSGISFADVAGYRAMVRFSQRCAHEGLENIWLPPSRSVQLLWRILGHPGGTIVDGNGPHRTAPFIAA